MRGEAESLAVVSQRRRLLEDMRVEEAAIAEDRALNVIAYLTMVIVTERGQDVVAMCLSRMACVSRRVITDGRQEMDSNKVFIQ